MNEPTEAQIKEFWEGYGVKPEPFVTDTYGEFGGRVTGGKYPPIDLNNLFRYAVPKYISQKCQSLSISEANAYRILFDEWLRWLVATAERPHTLAYVAYPALALFWALWQVKEGK